MRSKENLNQEIVPSSGKRVISDIVVAPKREIASQIFKSPPSAIKPVLSSWKPVWLKKAFLLTAAVIIILFLWGTLGARLKVKLAPKSVAAAINKTLVLAKAPGAGKLVFRTVALPDAQDGVFQTTEKKSQESRAEGAVVIFNKAKDPQVLIASTRLEAPNGKIYRIPRTIVVPASRQDGGQLTPGSKEVAVAADKPGSEYNLGLSDFTLPGLKGSPRYELVFARSKTEIKGGASGEQMVVGKGDRESAFTQLFSKAGSEAARLLAGKIPEDEFLLPPSVEFAVLKETLNPKMGEAADSFELQIEGEARAAIVRRSDLEAALFKDNPLFSNLDLSKLRIKNLANLNMKIIGYKFDAPDFNALISGKIDAEGAVDENAIKSFLARSSSDADLILSAFPELARAEVRLRPFWASPFYRWLRLTPRRIDIILLN